MSLEVEDDVALSQLLDNVRIKVDPKVGETLDGTCHALSIKSGNNVIGLEWNSQPPKGTGLEALIEKLSALAETCKSKRDTGQN